MDPTERVRAAQGDVWQKQGRLRSAFGGGAVEMPGVRIMSSGLPYPQWNCGDVSVPGDVDVAAVRAFYAARRQGRGVPWGLRVPVELRWPHGRLALLQRCMALAPASFRPAALPAGVSVRVAGAADLEIVAGIDASAFGDPLEQTRAWIGPQLGADGFTTAIAEADGDPVGIATSIATAERGGACVGIYGVAVLERARRRGIGGALTSWLLERTLEADVVAHLNPDGDSQARIYARLGFVEVAGFDVYVDI